MKHRDLRDIIGGLALATFGLAAAIYARDYEFGTLNRMGPGYFPIVLGILLAVLGLFVAIPAFFRSGPPIHVEWKTYALIMASIVVFGAALKTLGLIVATMLAVTVSSLADRQTRWKERILIAVGVAAITYAVFALGLSMVLPVWPWSD